MSEKKVECPHENGKLWGGRFDKGNDELMKLFNDSLSIDKRLWREDLIVNSLVYSFK